METGFNLIGSVTIYFDYEASKTPDNAPACAGIFL
jgi:hypothetical protein